MGVTTTTRAQAADEPRVEEDVIKAMRDRGIVNPDELTVFASNEAIAGACRWFDGQQNAGAGVLAKVIRDGGLPGWQPRRSQLDEQREYGEQICDWLNERFPQLRQASGRPHPAAIAAVIQLHFRVGKGQLTKSEHGPAIRAAVKAWEKKWA